MVSVERGDRFFFLAHPPSPAAGCSAARNGRPPRVTTMRWCRGTAPRACSMRASPHMQAAAPHTHTATASPETGRNPLGARTDHTKGSCKFAQAGAEQRHQIIIIGVSQGHRWGGGARCKAIGSRPAALAESARLRLAPPPKGASSSVSVALSGAARTARRSRSRSASEGLRAHHHVRSPLSSQRATS
jgi:hypothetical protein